MEGCIEHEQKMSRGAQLLGKLHLIQGVVTKAGRQGLNREPKVNCEAGLLMGSPVGALQLPAMKSAQGAGRPRFRVPAPQ